MPTKAAMTRTKKAKFDRSPVSKKKFKVPPGVDGGRLLIKKNKVDDEVDKKEEEEDAEDEQEDEEEPSQPRSSLQVTPGESPPAGDRQGCAATGVFMTVHYGGQAVVEETPVPESPLAKRVQTGLQINYVLEGDSSTPSLSGLIQLRSAGTHCDAEFVSGDGDRFRLHRCVAAACSKELDRRLGEAESHVLQLKASRPAVELVVEYLYGEVNEQNHNVNEVRPEVNEEVLQLACELALPKLSELCALVLALGVDEHNVVQRILLCEEFGLPRLRKMLVTSLIDDKVTLVAVSKDPKTLAHPALMRELLAAVARKQQALDV